jgi:hypothetical protein
VFCRRVKYNAELLWIKRIETLYLIGAKLLALLACSMLLFLSKRKREEGSFFWTMMGTGFVL